MASDQIHHQLHSTAPQTMFADHDHDLNGFSALFSNSADQAYEPHWNLDPTQPPQPSSVSQSWHPQTATARPHSLPAVNPAYSVQDPLYGRAFSNSPASFQHAYNHHGDYHSFSEPALDPALVAASSNDASNFNNNMTSFSAPITQASTIAPAALQSLQQRGATPQNAPTVLQQLSQNRGSAASPVTYSQPSLTQPQNLPLARPNFAKAPKATLLSNLWLTDYDELVKATQSTKLANFLNIGEAPQDISTNRTTIPGYQRRKSRNEIRALAAGDEKLLEKIARKPKKTKKVEIRIKKAIRSSVDLKGEPTDSSSDSYSDDSDYDSSDDEPPEVSPLAKVRPDRPIEAVKYDTIKAVWLPRRTTVQADQIRNSLKDFWEVIRTIRDRWKADTAAVKEAETTKNDSELPLLKDRVRAQREMMETALKTAIEHGHPEVLRLLGEHLSFIFVLYVFLADRVRNSDYTSPLPTAIFEILSMATAITPEIIDQTKLTKIFTLFSKRADEQTQARIKHVLENAAKNSKPKGSPPAQQKPADDKEKVLKSKGAENKDPISKVEIAKRSIAEPIAGVKRPRSSDPNPSIPSKRVASGSAPAVKPVGDAKVLGAIQKRPLSSAVEKSAAPSIIKQKVVAKPASLFAGLQSASKKPGAANKVAAALSKAGLATKGIEKKAPAVSTSKPAFSFADTMANLLKPKEPEPTAKPEEKRPPETADERAKRLRKEERRKLRVHWKPDISLVSVKFFHHDPEEERGHDASLVRDAGDVHGEGRMFKQHKDMMDLDEDEDQPSEESFRDWKVPSAIDFNEVEIDERRRNYEPFGGGFLKPECPEKEVQENREKNVLMVFYSHASDIPPSPKEPFEDETPPSKPPIYFGAPAEPTVSRAAIFAPAQAVPAQPPTVASSTAPDVTSLLSMLVPSAQAQPQQQASAPVPTNFDALEKLFGAVQSSAPPAVAPPAAPAQNQPPPQQNNLNAILASLQQFQNPQLQQQQPQQPPHQQSMAGAASWSSMQPSPAGLPNADQLIATLQQYSQLPTFNYSNVQAPQLPTMGPYEDPERKRMRDGNQEQERGSHHNKRRKWNDGEQGGKNPNPPKFVVPCRFWKDGKCKKGDDCTYLHT